MRFTVLSIFPEMIRSLASYGIMGRAIESAKIHLDAIDIREFTNDRHRTVDDRPYGGGAGMVMKPEPLACAIRAAKKENPGANIFLLSPQGRKFNQELASELARLPGMILVCGRYEGIDERVWEAGVDAEISIGDFVLTGGELAAMVIIDAVCRLIPGVLGSGESASSDTFSDGLLEHAHYTRPREFEGYQVPDALVSGNHEAIRLWRLESSLVRTLLKRPELLCKRILNQEELEILKDWYKRIGRILSQQSIHRVDPLPGEEQGR